MRFAAISDGGVDPVAPRHLHVHDHQVRLQLLGQFDRVLAVAGLADHVVALFAEHLHQVEPDQGLVLGDHDTRRGCRHPVRSERSSSPFSSFISLPESGAHLKGTGA